MNGKTPKIYAGFWRRLISMLIDTLILFPVLYVLLFVLPLVPNYAAKVVIGQLVWFLYFAGFESSSWRATPGRRIMSLYLVLETGGAVSFAKAAMRYIIFALPSVPYLVFTATPLYQKLIELPLLIQARAPITPEHLQALKLTQFTSYGALAGMILLTTLPIVFTKQKTAVHDLLMKTRMKKGKFSNTTAGEKGIEHAVTTP